MLIFRNYIHTKPAPYRTYKGVTRRSTVDFAGTVRRIVRVERYFTVPVTGSEPLALKRFFRKDTGQRLYVRFCSASLSGNRIVSAASPRMTGQQPLNRQITASEQAMFAQRLHAVLRAGRCITAGSRGKRRDAVPVNPDQQ